MGKTDIEYVTHSENPYGILYEVVLPSGEIFITTCKHLCNYCFTQKEWLFRKLLKVYSFEPKNALNLKVLHHPKWKGKTILIPSTTDIFEEGVPSSIIRKIIQKARELDKSNTIIWLTKNPARYYEFIHLFNPANMILGATIPTNIPNIEITNAPDVVKRGIAMAGLSFPNIFWSAEPLHRFTKQYITMIKSVKPKWIAIGSNTRNVSIEMPSREEVAWLVRELRKVKGLDVILKNNISDFGLEPDHHIIKLGNQRVKQTVLV